MPSTPSTAELVTRGASVELRDGSRIRLRQGHASDRELLMRGFARLGGESRYRRFLTATPELTETALHFLTAVDHHDHEAIIATDETTGEGVGVARYVRRPDHPEAGEVAVTVIDEWQRRGVGTMLLEALSARAREEGLTSFTALLLASNEEMIDLLRHLGPFRVVDRERGTLEIEMPIPQGGLSPDLRKLLRISALRRS